MRPGEVKELLLPAEHQARQPSGRGVDNAQMRSGESSGSRVKQLQDAEMVHSRAGTHLEGERKKKEAKPKYKQSLRLVSGFADHNLYAEPLFAAASTPSIWAPVLHYAFR